MTSAAQTMVRKERESPFGRLASVWSAARIDFTFDGPADTVIGGGQERTALDLACCELRRSGDRVCYERTSKGWTLYSFPDGKVGFSLNIRPRRRGLAWRLRGLLAARPRLAGFLAIVGPDGVGKSTTIQLVTERLSQDAPFLKFELYRWRPGLLPALSRLAGKPEQTGPSAFRPRRNAGKMQFVRVAYYMADYLAGSWWKLRKSSEPRLILFDRCALDMEVDPVRFGLTKGKIVPQLNRLIPEPACVILLHDDPHRIALRKDDLAEHDISAQMDTWLAMARQDRVHRVVEVDAPAEEVAERVYQALIEAFVDLHEQDFTAGTGEGIARAAQILRAPARRKEDPIRPQDVPSRYAALPGRDQARVLIPLLAPPVAAQAGLDIYNPQRPVARLAKSVLSRAFRLGIAQRLCSPVRLNTAHLEQRLSTMLGSKVSLSIALGSGAERQRVVLQATRQDGTIAAYIKAGTGPVAGESLRHEESVLRSLENATFSTALTPRVLGAFDYGTTRILIQSAPPPPCAPAPSGPLGSLQTEFLVDLHRHSLTAPMTLTLPRESARSLHQAGFPYYAHLIDWAARELESAPVSVPTGLAHADFAPWNLLCSGQRLFVFDWEFARAAMPPAYDLFHFTTASAVELHGLLPGVVIEDLAGDRGPTRTAVERYLKAIGVAAELWRPLLIWYLGDSLVTSVLRNGTCAGSKETAMRHAWSGLLSLLRYQPRTAGRTEPAP